MTYQLQNYGSAATSKIEGNERKRRNKSKPLRISQPGKLPMDVWWNVIDELEDNLNALAASALVCRGWAERSRRLLGKPIKFGSASDVQQIAKLGRTFSQEIKSCRRVVIQYYDRVDLKSLGLFATMFVNKMPVLKVLDVEGTFGAELWSRCWMHVDVFHYLSTFASITRLTLSYVTLPSVQTFGRLVSALPSLTALLCDWIAFRTHAYNPGTFLQRPRNLASLDLGIMMNLATMRGISNFLAATEMASTLKKISIRVPISLDKIDESGIRSLVSSAGPSLLSLNLSLYVSVDSLSVSRCAPIIDFSELVNLKHVRLEVDRPSDYLPFGVAYRYNLPHIIPWIHDLLTELPKTSTTLCDFTLRLRLLTSDLPWRRRAVRHRSHAGLYKLLDDKLSTAPFMGLKQFNFEVITIRLKATDKIQLRRLVRTRFPKLSARGVFR